MASCGARYGGTLMRRLLAPITIQHTTHRALPRAKRFYKGVSVAGTSGCYEINLDHRKLKTPLGHVLQIPSYPLALAVSEEWAAVKEEIMPSFMHLTGLSYTVVDNPTKISKWDMAEAILEFLPTDTMLFADENSKEFSALQQQEWWPVLEWFTTRHKLSIEPSTGIMPAHITDDTTAILRRHILSYNHWAVTGLVFSVEAIKSVILALTAMERRLSAAEATRLSRLEVDFQADHWGRVKWGHDMDQHDLEARFAAGLLFAQLNSAHQHKVMKKTQQHHFTH